MRLFAWVRQQGLLPTVIAYALSFTHAIGSCIGEGLAALFRGGSWTPAQCGHLQRLLQCVQEGTRTPRHCSWFKGRQQGLQPGSSSKVLLRLFAWMRRLGLQSNVFAYTLSLTHAKRVVYWRGSCYLNISADDYCKRCSPFVPLRLFDQMQLLGLQPMRSPTRLRSGVLCVRQVRDIREGPADLRCDAAAGTSAH